MKAKTGATVNQTLASVLWRSDSGVYRVLWELLRLTFWCFWSVALLCFSVPDRKLLSWWFNATWERISWCRQQQVKDRCRWCVTLSQAFISAVLTEDEQWPHSLGSARASKEFKGHRRESKLVSMNRQSDSRPPLHSTSAAGGFLRTTT